MLYIGATALPVLIDRVGVRVRGDFGQCRRDTGDVTRCDRADLLNGTFGYAALRRNLAIYLARPHEQNGFVPQCRRELAVTIMFSTRTERKHRAAFALGCRQGSPGLSTGSHRNRTGFYSIPRRNDLELTTCSLYCVISNPSLSVRFAV